MRLIRIHTDAGAWLKKYFTPASLLTEFPELTKSGMKLTLLNSSTPHWDIILDSLNPTTTINTLNIIYPE